MFWQSADKDLGVSLEGDLTGATISGGSLDSGTASAFSKLSRRCSSAWRFFTSASSVLASSICAPSSPGFSSICL